MAKIYQIDIEGIIGVDVIPSNINSKLKLANGGDIEVRFSSPGGFIFPGLQIFNLFRNYQGKKTARIVGLAASMASYIPMAFDEIIAEDNAVFMIHNARQGVAGDHNDMRKAADLLERMSGMLADAYTNKTKRDKKEIQAMMDKETFLFGQEIVDYGFADKLVKSDKKKDRVQIESDAQEQFQNCMTLLKEADKSEIEKAAAMLSPENTSIKINIEIDDTEMEPPEPATDLLNNFSDESGYNVTEEEYNSAENFNPEMPFPNFHACRVREPSEFEKGSFRTIKRGTPGKSSPNGRPLNIIIGKLKGKNTTTTQAFRYPKEEWSVSEAQNHCKSHDGKTFEPASGQKAEGCKDCGQKNSTHKNEQSPAAHAGENQKRLKMNLDEFLNQNPEARAEYEKRIAASAEKVENRIKAVSPFLGSKEYAKAMPMAVKALTGEVDLSAFKGAIAAFDMLREQNTEAAAQEDSAEPGETPANQPKEPSKNGDISKPEDIAPVVATMKNFLKVGI